jgi:hypothetical protein
MCSLILTTVKGRHEFLSKRCSCPVVLNEHVDHADGVFYCKAEETYPSKGAVYCSPLPLTFLFTPRNKREWKFSQRSTCCAAVRGIASVARLYHIPGQSLNLYAIHPSLAGRCLLCILPIHESTLPVKFSLRCSSLLPLIVDQTPRAFSAVITSPWTIFAVEPSGSGISIGAVGCSA